MLAGLPLGAMGRKIKLTDRLVACLHDLRRQELNEA